MKRKIFLKIKSVIKYILIFVALIACYNGLLYGACKIPSSMMKGTVEKSAEILKGQGIRYYFQYYAFHDNETDALMVNNAYSIDSEKPFDSYMWVRKNYDPKITKHLEDETLGELISYDEKDGINTGMYHTPDELQAFVDGKITHSISYQRYWHGYLVFLRILLLVFNVTELRVVRLLILGVVLLYLLKLLKKNFGLKAMFGMFAIFVLYEFYSIPASLASFPVTLITMLFLIFLLKKMGKNGKALHIEKLYKYFFIVGSLVNFVDFLSIPLISLGLPLLIVLMKYNETQIKNKAMINAKKCVKFVFIATAIWLAGYALTWLAKWIIFMIYTNQFELSNAISQIVFRMSHEIKHGDIGQNVLVIFLISIVVAAFSFVLAALRYRKIKPWRRMINDTLAIAIVGLYPVIWVAILLNHSAFHYFFTYRLSMITALASEMIAVYMFEPRKKKRRQLKMPWTKWLEKRKNKPEKLRII